MWSKSDGLLTSNHVINGQELHILHASEKDSGTYICSGKNKFGVHSSRSVVSVERRVAPEIMVGRMTHKIMFSGDRTSFACRITAGIPWPTVFWQTSTGYRVPLSYVKELKDGVALKFRKLHKDHSGSYICVASNIAGQTNQTVSIDVRGDPRVQLKPRGLYQVTYKDKVQLECLGYGYPVPAVAMTFPSTLNTSAKSIKMNHSEGYIKLEFEADFDFTGRYSCNGVNELGEKHDWVQIQVNQQDSLPMVNIIPSEITVSQYNEVKLYCDAKGIPGPSVHWTKGTSTDSIWNKPRLHLDSVSIEDAGEYHCHASNRKGSSRASAVVEVTVPPTAEIIPSSLVVKKGSSFNLKCQVSGSPAPSLEWKKVGEDELSSTSLLTVDDELIATSVRTDDAGTYVCLVKNIYGKSEARADIVIVEPPSLVTSKTVVNVNLTGSVKLNCNISGYPNPVIKWKKPNHSTGKNGAKGWFLISNATKYDQGQYRCQASNSAGVTEETFTVLINEIPKVIIAGPTVVSALAGFPKSFFCRGYGYPTPKLKWSKVNDELSTDLYVADGALHFTRISMEHSGIYRCTASNTYGKVLAEVRLRVEGSPVIKAYPSIINVNFREEARFFCSASGSPAPKISWLKVDGFLPTEIYIKEDYLLIPSVQIEDGGTYLCRAENEQGTSEAMVTLNVYEFIPLLNSTSNSMIIFETIKDTLFNTKIELSIKPISEDGLIFYCGKYMKDFISVSLKKGFIVFQFDLGSGQAILKSNTRVKMNKWTTIVARRDRSTGFLKIDDDNEIFQKSLGRFTGLNLDSEVFLGGHEDYDKIFKQIEVKTGFTGCISRLLINDRKIDFVASALQLQKVVACDTCQLDLCQNDGICSPFSSKHGFQCNCSSKFTGLFCEQRVERCYPNACGRTGKCVNKKGNGFTCKCSLGQFGKWCEQGNGHPIKIPSFNRDSFIMYRFPVLFGNLLKISISMKVWSQANGIVFSVMHTFRSKQKYLQIAIENGFVVLHYNLGDSPVSVRSGEKVVVGDWVKVYIEQRRKYGSLSLNGGQAFKNVSRGREASLHLNANSMYFIGGVKGQEIGGMVGCIRELQINEKPVKLDEDFIEANRFSSCYKFESPCLSQPCKHNGTCQMLSKEHFQCQCPVAYTGKRCGVRIKLCGLNPDCRNDGECASRETKQNFCLCPLGFGGVSCENPVKLHGRISLSEESFLVYPKSLISRVERTRIEISFRTTQSNGLILWYGADINVTPDYLSLGIRDGFLEVQYELGSGSAEGSVKTKVDDGRWHTVKIDRDGANLTFYVDDHEGYSVVSEGNNRNLDVYSVLHLGGGRHVSRMTRQIFLQGFAGCMKNFVVDGKAIDFKTMPERGFNVLPCHKE